MANEIEFHQKQGPVSVRRRITPTTNGVLGFDSSGKLSNIPNRTYTVATLPAASTMTGRVVYVTNGSAGSPSAAISDGTNWKVVALGATVAAS